MTRLGSTERARSVRTGQVQVWAAVSESGRWRYARLDGVPGTPWLVVDLTADGGTGRELDGWYGSLSSARRATAGVEAAEGAAEQAAAVVVLGEDVPAAVVGRSERLR